MNDTRITIGKSETRKDGRSKVDGSGLYTADIPLQRKNYAVAVRSLHHHARIVSVDISAAKSMPGVLGVVISEDIPGARTFGALVDDQPVLAEKVVRHMGEPIALVIADSKHRAEQAARKVLIQYEILPAEFDPIQAIQSGAPLIHEDGNLLCEFDVSDGKVDVLLAKSAVVVEEDFSVARISPAYMETENSLARFNTDGTITVWVNSQKPFEDQKAIAAVLGLSIDQVEVVGSLVGGAFGGKEDSSIAILTALAAWKIQGIVQIANRRNESFTSHPKRHPARIHIKMGAKKDGTLTGVDITAYLDTGAYASYGPAVGGLFTEMAPGPYRYAGVHVHTNVVYTNSPYAGAMRGFGAPQAHFAIESCLDMLAEKLGMDGLDLRRKNVLRPGDRLFTQVVMDDSAKSLVECLDILQDYREKWKDHPTIEGMVTGVGYALAIQSMGLGAKVLDESAHRLEWLPDGRVLIHLGAPDLGQGLTTVAEQMVAEALELPYSQIITNPLDTLSTPNGGVTCGSRMTYLVGKALLLAADKLKQELLLQAADFLHIPVSNLKYANGIVETGDGAGYPASEFTSRLAEKGIPIQSEGKAEFPYPEDTTPQHLPIGMPHVKFTFAGQIVRVEVDPELGSVKVLEVAAVHDLGCVINRMAAEGQIEGGIAMGIGYALLEEMPIKPDGSWVDSFTEYLLPTSVDMPEKIHLHLLEISEETGPYGAKGVAEISLVPTAPAITNAIYNALKSRVRELPATPEKILNGICR